MPPLGTLPEFQKPHVTRPLVNSLSDLSPSMLTDLQSYLSQFQTEVPANAIVGLAQKVTGGLSTQTPGAVATVTIPHGLTTTPSGYSVQPADADSRAAPAFFLSADADNLTLNFASNLTAATQYMWVWMAIL